MRFGFECGEKALATQSRSILVVDPIEMSDDIVRELHEVLDCLCGRLYQKKSAQRTLPRRRSEPFRRKLSIFCT
ncbi:recombinase family protein [Candidatus Methylacidithermus pantelleriae]|uniref:Resolvase/invertase-type recombinase catalytic domain-containing protein n=1 Tax=Candidatus Methylacidithermus pantelleriae TaxID=2744239 RepID=A0A8J2BKZ2_9BACT|nr:hypothetical protein [Candidatus Methylacidithermus pantelleriae]CAF0703823.1 hypothetical protein MPNT_60112 [Candidatus Methylacidithermus pantelleriae]